VRYITREGAPLALPLAPSGTVGVVIEQQARPRVSSPTTFGASVRQFTLYGHDVSPFAYGPAGKDLLSNTSLQVDPPTAGASPKELQSGDPSRSNR